MKSIICKSCYVAIPVSPGFSCNCENISIIQKFGENRVIGSNFMPLPESPIEYAMEDYFKTSKKNK